jgi:hypothetical protein
MRRALKKAIKRAIMQELTQGDEKWNLYLE